MPDKLTNETNPKITPRGAEVKEAQCPNCGAPMAFDTAKGKLTCSYCGTEIDTGSWEDHEISGFDFEDVESHAFQENAEDIPVYNCVSCGAEILAAQEEISLTCPYCGNNIVLTEKISGKLRPNAVIPFKITPDALPGALQEYYKDKVLLPKDFFSERKVGKVTGIYVPFWSFTGTVAGDVSYTAETTSTHSTSDEEITVTNEYKLLRNASVSFKDLLLDASEKMDDAFMDSIMPYDMSEAKDFNMAYLAGFAADRFDSKSEALSTRAEERMKASTYKAVLSEATSGYGNAKVVGSALKAAMKEVKYLLLPVYTFDIIYQGNTYHYTVNGQTGKVAGSVPIAKSSCRKYQGIRAAIVFAAIMAVSVISYFMGV